MVEYNTTAKKSTSGQYVPAAEINVDPAAEACWLMSPA